MITNGSAAGQRGKIKRFGLAPYFESILVEGEFGLGKPHREVYETVLGALACDGAKAWSVGDNLEWDVGAPQALGVYGIWVDAAGADLPEGSVVKPDRTVRSIRELLPTG
jgi:putative hydrolase of the HAD superfamily